jgi:hypothetical protein
MAVRAAQVALGLFGLVVTSSAAFFTFVEPPAKTYAFDPIVSAFALAMGVGALYLTFRLSRGGTAVRRAVLALVAGHVLFTVLNVTVYDEPESVAFLVVDALIAGMVSLPSARAFFGTGTGRHPRAETVEATL